MDIKELSSTEGRGLVWMHQPAESETKKAWNKQNQWEPFHERNAWQSNPMCFVCSWNLGFEAIWLATLLSQKSKAKGTKATCNS